MSVLPRERDVVNGRFLPNACERFHASYTVNPETGCWEWTRRIQATGYVLFGLGAGGHVAAHRWSYQTFVGAIPHGYQIDHLCRVRHCVNPAHLEAVTPRENLLRSNHPVAVIHRSGVCKRGHPITPENREVRRNGTPGACLPCRTAYNKQRWAEFRK